MEPPSTKTCLLSHAAYRITKEPAIASCVCLNNGTSNNDPNRLFKGEPFIEHVKIAALFIDFEIADFDAEPNFRNGRRIIHPSGVDGARDEEHRQ